MPFPSDTTPDTQVFDLIDREVQRQVTGIQLIASENFTSPAVMTCTVASWAWFQCLSGAISANAASWEASTIS